MREHCWHSPFTVWIGSHNPFHCCDDRLRILAAIACVIVRLRSEEHTSELQSQSNLVCRLLLVKTNSYSAQWAPRPTARAFALLYVKASGTTPIPSKHIPAQKSPFCFTLICVHSSTAAFRVATN